MTEFEKALLAELSRLNDNIETIVDALLDGPFAEPEEGEMEEDEDA